MTNTSTVFLFVIFSLNLVPVSFFIGVAHAAVLRH